MDYFRRIKDIEEELKIFFLQRKDLLKKAALPVLLAVALLIFFVSGGDDSVTLTDESGSEAAESGMVSGDGEDTDGLTESGLSISGGNIYVDIGGEVKSPGVYEVKEGTRLFQLIEKAGGLTDEADIDVINRAEAVYDGQKILIASYEETETAAKTAKSDTAKNTYDLQNSAADERVNINTADSVTLQTIPGIGPSKADRIIEYRNSEGRFNKIEDIKNISGIGDKTFESIKKYITV